MMLITIILINSLQTLNPGIDAPSLQSDCDKPSVSGFNFMKEKWKDVVGYEGLYMVSDFSRVKALAQIITMPNGGIFNKPERILSANIVQGYQQVCLSKKGQKYFKIHRLSSIAFIPNPENKPQVNHKDGNKLNNHISNLEWVTCSENHLHAFATKLRLPQCGFDHHSSKTVLHLETGIFYGSAIEAAKTYGFNEITLHAMLVGRNPNRSKMVYV